MYYVFMAQLFKQYPVSPYKGKDFFWLNTEMKTKTLPVRASHNEGTSVEITCDCLCKEIFRQDKSTIYC